MWRVSGIFRWPWVLVSMGVTKENETKAVIGIHGIGGGTKPKFEDDALASSLTWTLLYLQISKNIDFVVHFYTNFFYNLF